MFALDQEIVRVAQKPTAERVKALKRIIPCSLLKASLKATGADRPCRRVPKWFMLWFVIGLGLFATDCYRQIFRWLQRFRPRSIPARTTLCEARQRLGVAPVRWLLNHVVVLLATRQTPDAFYRSLRLMALDAFVVDVPDTAANARVFGRPKGGRTPGAFPQVRVLALCEIGTHVLWHCLLKPLRCAEIVMAKALLRYLAPDMLLLWDRGFLSYDNVRAVLAGEAHLLARIKKNLVFVKLRVYRDGSYLAKMYPSAKHRRHDQDGIEVRLIEYTLRDPGRPGSGTVHRLLTTLLDARLDPAKRLIELYHERWEEELAIDELKTHQRQRPVLRSQTPAGVVQEIYGLLLAHFVVRKLMCEAAVQHQLSPRRLSFTGTLKILRCRLPECPRDVRGGQRWYRQLLTEIAEETLEERRDRVNPRVIKCKMSKWAKKRPEHRQYPQPEKDFREGIVIIR
jgi:Insertion element 4 transposase N-terminal/Transposase DDE domain